MALVVAQAAEDDVGASAIHGSPRFFGSLGFGELLQVVVAAWTRVADLVKRDDVDGNVQLTVASAGESVLGLVAAGGVDGFGRCWRSGARWEPGGIARATDDLGCRDGGDTRDLGQGGPGVRHQSGRAGSVRVLIRTSKDRTPTIRSLASCLRIVYVAVVGRTPSNAAAA